jgi:hypothetical protein
MPAVRRGNETLVHLTPVESGGVMALLECGVTVFADGEVDRSRWVARVPAPGWRCSPPKVSA